MKFRILVQELARLLGKADPVAAPRADMYLPPMVLALGLVSLAGGVGVGIGGLVTGSGGMLGGAAAALVLGVLALLCWANQSIVMLSDEKFAYTTFLGNTHEYAFAEITGLRRNADSMTLFVAGKKVHIEACAVISDRLAERLNAALAQTAEP